MSENEIIRLGERIEKMLQLMKRIEKMLLQQTLLHKEVLNSKETATYMGLSVSGVYKLRRKSNLQGYRPNNGRLYFKRMDVYNWMLSTALGSISDQKKKEEEKLSILNPEMG